MRGGGRRAGGGRARRPRRGRRHDQGRRRGHLRVGGRAGVHDRACGRARRPGGAERPGARREPGPFAREGAVPVARHRHRALRHGRQPRRFGPSPSHGRRAGDLEDPVRRLRRQGPGAPRNCGRRRAGVERARRCAAAARGTRGVPAGAVGARLPGARRQHGVLAAGREHASQRHPRPHARAGTVARTCHAVCR